MKVRISRREWQSALAVAFIATVIMQIPYAFGYAFASRDVEYTGLLINLEDYSYHAIMLQGYNGAWLDHIQYTTEPHASAFLYGFYLFLGHLARTLGVTIVAMWHASRFFASLVLLLATFGFVRTFLQDSRERWTAYLIAVFGSGFDWTLFPWEPFEPTASTPLDFRMPEMHLFFTALTYPHITLGVALVLGTLWLWHKYQRSKRWQIVGLLAAAILSVCIIYPFLIVLLVSVLGLNWGYESFRSHRIQWPELFALIVSFAPSIPLNLYYAFVLQTNPVFREWNEQAATPSPNPLHYLLAYGGLLALLIPLLRSPERAHFRLLWTWIAVAAVLLYAPLGAQRRFVQGVQVPLAILASAGLYRAILPRLEKATWFRRLAALPNYSPQGLQRFIVVLTLLVLSSANWIVLTKLCTLTAIEQPPAFFVPKVQVAGIDWLRSNTKREDAIFAAYWTSGYIPARSGNLVFAGQRYETNHFDEKRLLVAEFFDEKTDDAFRRDLLVRNRIAYVFWGDQERELGTYDPARSTFLEPAYDRGGVRIYRVSILAD